MAKRVETTVVEGIEIDAQQAGAVPVASGAGKPPKRGRKAELEGETFLSPAPDYGALGLTGPLAEKLEEARQAMTALGQRSTAHVFECGEVLDEVQQLAPDQKTFGKWTKAIFGISRTGAENLARVHRNLSGERLRLVKVGMAASALYALATAEPDKVESVLGTVEGGTKLSVAQVKALVAGENQDQAKGAATADDGGPAGLKTAVTEKVGYSTKVFFDTLFLILCAVDVHLERHADGRAINKGKAVDDLMHPARLANGLLVSLLHAAQVPGAPVPAGVIHVLPGSESRRVVLQRVLYRMGAVEAWPKSEGVGAWFAETVLPDFEWALGAERAAKAKAVLEERAVAADAEKRKVDKALKRSKADAAKADRKAGRDKAVAPLDAQPEIGEVAELVDAPAAIADDQVAATGRAG